MDPQTIQLVGSGSIAVAVLVTVGMFMKYISEREKSYAAREETIMKRLEGLTENSNSTIRSCSLVMGESTAASHELRDAIQKLQGEKFRS